MEKKLKILQLSPQFPLPADNGGKIGIINITKQFYIQGADVTFFAFQNENIDQNLLSEFSDFASPNLFNHSLANSKFRIIQSFISKKSIYLTKHSNSKILKHLTQLINDNDFDVIHADHSAMAYLALQLKSITGLPVGIRLHNIEWMIWQRYANSLKNKLKKYYIQKQADLLKNAEIEMYSKADICFAITDHDKKLALEMAPTANIKLASVGVNADEWMSDEQITRNDNELIIATLYSWIHNVDAVRWLIYDVLPIIRKQIPDIKLTLIGANPPDWLINCKEPGVNCIGYVDRVQPYLNKATLYVAPLFTGSGIRIKILEALAMGLPVVATPISSEGINGNFKNGLYVCNTDHGFANVVIGLLTNKEVLEKSRIDARDFVINNFSWKKNVEIMVDEYKRICRK